MPTGRKHPVIAEFWSRDSKRHKHVHYMPGDIYSGPHGDRYMVANRFRKALVGPPIDEPAPGDVDDLTEEK